MPTNANNKDNVKMHHIKDLSLVQYPNIYAWVLTKPRAYDPPYPFQHVQGAHNVPVLGECLVPGGHRNSTLIWVQEHPQTLAQRLPDVGDDTG